MKIYIKMISLAVAYFASLGGICLGDSLALSKVAVAGVTKNIATVGFDIVWSNSWRIAENVGNWDAAWVFLKYYHPETNRIAEWQHAVFLKDRMIKPLGATVTITEDGLGAFIYRSKQGVSSIRFEDINLSWACSTNINNTNDLVIRLFAIEMVLVPQGGFYVGDGSTINITGQFEAGTSGVPFRITGEKALTLGGGVVGSLGNNNAVGMAKADDFKDAVSKTLPVAFPKGFRALYSAKYHLSQGEYAKFLNTLSAKQAEARYHQAAPLPASRYYLAGVHSNIVAHRPWRACNFISWGDAAAYADWAGLRPMTELEYEKICRGPKTPVAGEYAWGTTNIHNKPYIGIHNDGGSQERVARPGTNTGNAVYAKTFSAYAGPSRCGIFARSLMAPTREESGAGYYGTLDMSGNLWTHMISVGSEKGRGFTGLHGDGYLDARGNANVTNWPGVSAVGTGQRGGSWETDQNALRVSARKLAAYFYALRAFNRGFRAVRTAP